LLFVSSLNLLSVDTFWCDKIFRSPSALPMQSAPRSTARTKGNNATASTLKRKPHPARLHTRLVARRSRLDARDHRKETSRTTHSRHHLSFSPSRGSPPRSRPRSTKSAAMLARHRLHREESTKSGAVLLAIASIAWQPSSLAPLLHVRPAAVICIRQS
jgi:hypothetical protein